LSRGVAGKGKQCPSPSPCPLPLPTMGVGSAGTATERSGGQRGVGANNPAFLLRRRKRRKGSLRFESGGRGEGGGRRKGEPLTLTPLPPLPLPCSCSFRLKGIFFGSEREQGVKLRWEERHAPLACANPPLTVSLSFRQGKSEAVSAFGEGRKARGGEEGEGSPSPSPAFGVPPPSPLLPRKGAEFDTV
jgi:hypothetical protein